MKHKLVVIATTKVRIFKQITTITGAAARVLRLLLLPQRYVFSSKSQHLLLPPCRITCCYCYHKGTYFQANHNSLSFFSSFSLLLLLPQRYVFSSKSQQKFIIVVSVVSCYCYHKGTYFQANHNKKQTEVKQIKVVIATTKVRIFKQITTCDRLIT